jgi:hypothetical protein
MYCKNCGSDHIVGHPIWNEIGIFEAIDYECQVCYTSWQSNALTYLAFEDDFQDLDVVPDDDGEFE